MPWTGKIVLGLLRNKIIISYLIGGAVVLILYLVIITCAKILAPPVLTALSITLLILIIGLPISLVILALYYIVASVLAFRELKRKIFYIDNDEINVLDSKNTSKFFLRETEEDTLIAILEWIHRNIRFWNERCYLAIGLYIVTAISIMLGFLPSTVNTLAQQYNLRIHLDSTMFIGIALIAFILTYAIVYSQLSPYIRAYKRGFLEILTLMLKPILNVSEVLNLRLAICKDYARFTAAILLKLYPEKPIYIVMIPRHAACAIEFSGKTYVLDQKLPIMTLSGWRKYWCKRLGSRASMKIYRLDREVVNGKVYFVPRLVKKQKLCTDYSVNIEQILNKLSMKLSNNFTMKHTIKNMQEGKVNYYERDIEILNYIGVLDDDDLVIKSLYKLVLLKLENELLDKINSVVELKPYVCNDNALCVKAVIASEDRT